MSADENGLGLPLPSGCLHTHGQHNSSATHFWPLLLVPLKLAKSQSVGTLWCWPSGKSPAVPRVFQGSQVCPSGWPAVTTGRDQFSGESAFLFGGGNLELLTSEVNRIFSLLSFLSVYLTRKHCRDWLALCFVGFQHIWLYWITFLCLTVARGVF